MNITASSACSSKDATVVMTVTVITGRVEGAVGIRKLYLKGLESGDMERRKVGVKSTRAAWVGVKECLGQELRERNWGGGAGRGARGLQGGGEDERICKWNIKK